MVNIAREEHEEITRDVNGITSCFSFWNRF